jgi:radical SAM protein with 4Fe4S-binding SPASM domain
MGENQPQHNHGELSIENIQKISQSMGHLLWVLFSGGEPYLCDDIVEISRRIYEHNKPVILTYPTNGLLPEVIQEKTEQILKFARKSIVVVKLSLDGLNNMHDTLRGVNGCFEKVIQTYHRLCKLVDIYPNFELGINTVFCSANQDNMDEILRFVNGLEKISNHSISLIRGRDYLNVDLQKYHDTVEMLKSNLRDKTASIYRFKGARIKAAQDILQYELIYQTLMQQKRIIPCYAGRLNIVLTETGEVYPCETLLNHSMGNVGDFNYNMKMLLDSAQAKEVICNISKSRCYCSHECYFTTNILFNPWMLLFRLAREYSL